MWSVHDARRPHAPQYDVLEKTEIVAQFAEQTSAPVAIVIVVVAPALEVTFDAMQEHFAADDCGSTSERAHCHVAAATSKHSAKSSLLLWLTLHRARCRNDTRQAGAATRTVGCSLWRHRHADGTAQDHWLLAEHRSGLRITPLRVGLLRVAGLVLRLAIGLLRILRLLRIRLLIRAGLWWILRWWLMGIGIGHRLSGRRCEWLAATIAEFGAWIVLCAATGAERLAGYGRGHSSLH